jgi:1-acyl-sn-glycerol-3-phosphate acyltransferase
VKSKAPRGNTTSNKPRKNGRGNGSTSARAVKDGSSKATGAERKKRARSTGQKTSNTSAAPGTLPAGASPSQEPGDDAPEATTPVAAELRVLEQRLERVIHPAGESAEDVAPISIREQVTVAAREVVDRIAAPVARVEEAGVVDTVRDLFSSDYYLRQWTRIGMRNRSEEVDDFGLDSVYEERLRPFIDLLYERYFRIETEGIENVPGVGRCLVVANHSGTLPLDGLMLRACLRHEHPSSRELRWLAEDFVYYLPFVGAFMSRIGGVRACQENAERLLAKESLVAVFPEGVKGIGKLYRDRYRLQRFGRGGFIRLSLRTGTPLVPCAVVGAEEASPMLHRDELVSRLVGLPYLPVTPTFPWLGPLGLVPAPTKWRIRFGEIMHFDEYGPAAAEDHVLVGRLAERVRANIQQLLDQSLAQRKSVWFG